MGADMRPRLGSRLYLDRSRDRPPNWVIRDGATTIRTGAKESEWEKARDALHLHQIGTGELAGISSDIDYRRPTMERKVQTIYFVSCAFPDFPIKIGIAANVDQRLCGLQNALPYRVVLLATMPGTHLDERQLHTRFDAYRLHGEWFKPEADLMEYIAKIGTVWPI